MKAAVIVFCIAMTSTCLSECLSVCLRRGGAIQADYTQSSSNDGPWGTAQTFPNGWSYLPWFGYFVQLEQDWIYHLEHGYQYCIGEDTTSVYIYDLRLQSWIWTSEGVYPNISKSGENSGWYFYSKGGTSGSRWFWRSEDGEWIAEASINDPISNMPIAFASIVPGSFIMGSPEDEMGRLDDEAQHSVTITRAFSLQTTEVTWAQWNEVRDWALESGYTDLPAGRNGFNGDTSGGHPVTEVSWYDVVKWLNAKTEMENSITGSNLSPCYRVEGSIMKTGELTPSCDFDASGYRLPTESEWEYACRAGTKTAFYGGPITYVGTKPLDPTLDLISWYGGNSDSNTHPVGGKEPNDWGLFDMSGNVYEWCWDRYDTYPETATNPEGPDSGSYRMLRGGDFNFIAKYCRSAYRVHSHPDNSYAAAGFRPARSE